MTTGRINQVATLRGTDASRSSVKKKAPRDEAPSATRPPKRAATGGCFALNVVTSRRRQPRLSRNRNGRPRGLSLAAISALNSRDGPRNRRTRPASRTPSGDASRRIDTFPRKKRSTHQSARAQGRQARRASPRPPRGVGDTAGRNQCLNTSVAARQSGPTRFVTTYDFASRIKTNPIIVRRPSQQKQRQPRPPRPVGSESDRTMGANTRRFARGAEPGSRRAAVRGRPSQTTSERTSRGCRSSNYSRLAQSSDRRAPRRQKPPKRPLRSRVAQSRRTASQLAPFDGVRSRGALARAPLSWVRETHVRAIAAHEGVEWISEGSDECKYTCHARHVFADLQRPTNFGTAEVTSHPRARELGAPAARAQPASNAPAGSPKRRRQWAREAPATAAGECVLIWGFGR